MKVSDVLDRAADLIEPYGAWTQGANARADDGREANPAERDATCWCALGAIYRSVACGPVSLIDGANDALSSVIGGNIVLWNDDHERTQAEVVAALRAAAHVEREAGR